MATLSKKETDATIYPSHFIFMSKFVFDADKVRKTFNFSFPSCPGSELVFYTQLTVGEEKELANLYPNYTDKNHSDSMAFMRAVVVKILKSWNFTDSEDKDIPLDQADVIFNQIPSGDLGKLMMEITKVNKETIGDQGLVQLQK